MKQYLYPNNLRAAATLWLWGLRDFVIIAVAALLSIIGLVQLGWMLPPVLTMCYAFATIRMDETTILD